MATPDAAAQMMASDHRVLGAAGLVGGSPPLVRRQAARNRARVAEPAATPLSEPSAFQRSRRSAIDDSVPHPGDSQPADFQRPGVSRNRIQR